MRAIIPVPVPNYSVTNWWRTKERLLEMENEWALLLHYCRPTLNERRKQLA